MSFLDNLKAAFNARPVSLAYHTTPQTATMQPSAAPPAAPTGSPVVGCSAAAWAAYKALLALREGDVRKVYLDSLKKPTGGEGHLITPEDHMKVGDVVTAAQDEAWFNHDGASAMTAAVAQAAQAGITSQEFLPYLASVSFQLGNKWTAKFPNTWRMICAGQYATAAAAFTHTLWDEQTHTRVQDFRDALNRLPAKS